MNNESWRTEIKRANNSFKRMKSLADILTDAGTAKSLLQIEGYTGSLTDMIKKLIGEVKKNDSKCKRSDSKLRVNKD